MNRDEGRYTTYLTLGDDRTGNFKTTRAVVSRQGHHSLTSVDKGYTCIRNVHMRTT